MSANQQIVCNNINCIGGDIGPHGDLGITCPTLRRIDSHLNTVKNHATHNDPEIGHCAVMCIRCRATQRNNRTSQQHKSDTQYHCSHNDKNNRCIQNPVCFFLPVLPPSSGYQCRHCHIECKKQRQSDKFRLRRQSHSCYRFGSQRAYHQGINQTRKGSKEGLNNGRPCHVNGYLYIFFLKTQLFRFHSKSHPATLLFYYKRRINYSPILK